MPETDFYERLIAELDKMPRFDIDINKASTDELVRGMIKMMTGNGNQLHGYMAKVAAINLRVEDIQRGMSAQIERCDKVLHASGYDNDGKPVHRASDAGESRGGSSFDSAQEDERKSFAYMIGKFAIVNWKAIAVLLICGALFLSNVFNMRANTSQQEAAAQQLQQLQRTLAVLTGEQPAQPAQPTRNHRRITPSEDKHGNDSRPDDGK